VVVIVVDRVVVVWMAVRAHEGRVVGVGVVPVVVGVEMLVLHGVVRMGMSVALERMQGDTRDHEGGGHG